MSTVKPLVMFTDAESDDLVLQASEDDVMDYLEGMDEEELALLTPETRAR